MIIELVNLLFGLTVLLGATTIYIYGVAYSAKLVTEWGHRRRGRSVSREAESLLFRENMYAHGGVETRER